MTDRILCVDDDLNILRAFERQFRNVFNVCTAHGPAKALQAIAENGPFAVVVSDLRMPEMNGVEFLSQVRLVAPDTVRVMLTGTADLNWAMIAVNEGRIFQFLTKPCPTDMLARTLETALEQHRLITAERELLERTLQGSIGILIEILSHVNPTAFSRSHRIRRYVRHMAQQLNLADRWQYELAATLSQIGYVVVPSEIMEKYNLRRPLTAAEEQIVMSQSQLGHNLLAKIPRLEKIAQMIARQSSAWADADASDPIAIGANLLRVALDFDEQILEGKCLGEAVGILRARKTCNIKFVDALRRLEVGDTKNQIRLLKVDQLKPGMITESDLYSKNGLLLLAKGQEVTESAIARLESFASLFGVAEPVSVIVPGGEFEDIPASLADLAGPFPGLTENSSAHR